MRYKWLFLFVFPLLLMSLLPLGCSCNCSTDNSGIGGDWNPQDYESFESTSPDGTKLLSYRGRSLYIRNVDGTDEKVLVSGDDESWALDAVWSLDGSRIAYRMWWPSGMWSEIWVINADGSGKVIVGDVPAKYWISSIEWLVDGTKITYKGFDMWAGLSSDSTYEAGPNITYTVNADGFSLTD